MATSIQRITTFPVRSGSAGAAAISANSEVIYVGGNSLGYGYKSTDQGATWTQLPLLGAVYVDWISLATSANGSVVYASANKRIYKSTDYGASWTQIYLSTTSISSVCCSSDGNIVYFAATTDKLYKIVGSGSATPTTTQISTKYLPIVSCSDDGTIVAISDGGLTTNINVSKDGGATWTAIATTHMYWNVKVIGNGTKVYAAGAGRFVRINTTGTPTLLDNTVTSVNFANFSSSYDGVIVLAYASSKVLKSTDSGLTFTVDTTSISNFSDSGGVFASRTADRAVITGSNAVEPFSSVLYMYTGVGSDALAAAAPCFLGDARVATPSGLVAIADIKEGDMVLSATDGTPVRVQRVVTKQVKPTIQNIPYIIPAGTWGAQVDLPISPDHRVAVPQRGLVKASQLGLDRLILSGPFTYYNLEVENCENIVVEGVTVESLAHAKQYRLTMAEFAGLIKRLESRGQKELAGKLLAKAQQQGTSVHVPLYIQRK